MHLKTREIVLIFIFLLATACSNFEKNISNFKNQSKNYTIEEIKNGSNIAYSYIIYDNNHFEMDRGTAYRIKPNTTSIYGVL